LAPAEADSELSDSTPGRLTVHVKHGGDNGGQQELQDHRAGPPI
jgi:hypothetical protein